MTPLLLALAIILPGPPGVPTEDLVVDVSAVESEYVPIDGIEHDRRIPAAAQRARVLIWRAEQSQLELEAERAAAEAAAAAAAEAERAAEEEAAAAVEVAVTEPAKPVTQELEPAGPGCWEPWCSLAQCESGGTWDYDASRYSFGNGLFDGGLQFHPSTWTDYKDPGDPQYAWQASPARQIAVAERVLAAQGWGAWPTCSRKLGLR